ncbi:MAG: hypothetical protein NTW03_04310, partial [Verrucomicrobia bacterium]|nr:hypothetical protein [Verrucomicrobiota bacterium]
MKTLAFSLLAFIALLADSVKAAPDLRGYPPFDVVQSSVPLGDLVTINFAVLNFGTSRSVASAVRFYLSPDANIDPATDIPISRDVGPLPEFDPNYGSSYTVNGLLLVTQNQLAALGGSGTYYIGMVVDSQNQNDEGQDGENNNRNLGMGTDMDSLTITIPQPDMAGWDARPDSDDYFAVLSSNLTWGDECQLRFSVVNHSPGNAGPFKVKFYLSSDSTITTNDFYFATVHFDNGLSGWGWNGSTNVSFNLPVGTPFG